MATVTGFTAVRAQAVEDANIVSAAVVGDDLILYRHDGGTINAGNVRGPQGIQGDTGPIGDPIPAGTIIQGNWVTGTAPSGYSLLDGSTIVNGATTYPNCAAAWPQWVSGNDLVKPNLTDRVLVSADTAGSSGGDFTITLTTSQMPSHAHGLSSHHHTATGTYSVDIDHDHGSFSTTSIGAHAHGFGQEPLIYVTQPGLGYFTGDNTGSTLNNTSPINWNGDDGSHSHTINVPNYNTGNRAVVGTSGPPNVTDTQYQGSGNSFEHRQPYYTVLSAVKLS